MYIIYSLVINLAASERMYVLCNIFVRGSKKFVGRKKKQKTKTENKCVRKQCRCFKIKTDKRNPQIFWATCVEVSTKGIGNTIAG